MLYRGMGRAALDAAYDNGAAVGPVKRERYFADRRTRSEAFRERHSGRIDVPCGAGAGAPRRSVTAGPHWNR